MAEITATMIKDLRERTGAGMSDCKKALTETDGDMEKAIEYLRKKGLAAAAKKAGRIATEGAVTSYIHNGRVGVLSRSTARPTSSRETDDFKRSSRTSRCTSPARRRRRSYVSDDRDRSGGAGERARDRSTRQGRASRASKPEAIDRARSSTGRSPSGRRTSACSIRSGCAIPTARRPSASLLTELVAKLGENIKIRRFVRWELGEGLEKKKDDFAAEVAKQAGL